MFIGGRRVEYGDGAFDSGILTTATFDRVTNGPSASNGEEVVGADMAETLRSARSRLPDADEWLDKGSEKERPDDGRRNDRAGRHDREFNRCQLSIRPGEAKLGGVGFKLL